MVLRRIFLFSFLFLQVASAELLPMQPLVNTRYNELIGLTIETGETAQGFRQMQTLGLQPFYYQGKVYGTIKKYQGVSMVNRVSVGLSFSFSRTADDVLYLGSDLTYGFKLDWGGSSSSDLRSQSGLWISDPVTSVLQAGSVLSQRKTSFEVTEDVLRLAAVTSSMEERRNSLDWPEQKFPKLKQQRAGEMVVAQDGGALAPVTVSSVQKKLEDLAKPENLSREVSWSRYVRPVNDNAPVWNNPEAQAYVQNICDRLLKVKDLLPIRCRVFASLAPYAFSYPGGDLFVTAGLLQTLESEDALAFFLGHELSHVVSRHFSENLRKKDYHVDLLNTVSLVSAVLSFKTPQTQLVNTVGDFVSTLSLQNIYMGLMTNYTPNNELEADRLGLEMAMSAGYDKNKILADLAQLNALLKADFSRPSKGFSPGARYPQWEARLEALRRIPGIDGGASAATNGLSSIKASLKLPFDYFRLGSALQE